MLALLRRDPVMGSRFIKLSLAFILSGSLVEGMRTALAASSEGALPGENWNLLIVGGTLWLALSVFLLFGDARQRCRPFDLALPLSAARLWLAHLFAVLIAGSTILIGTAGLMALHYRIISGFLAKIPITDSGALSLVVPMAASMILAVVLLQSTKHSLYRIPETRSRTLFSMVVLASGFGLGFLLHALPLPFALFPLCVAAVLALRTYRRIPPAFDLFPLDSTAGDSQEPEALQPAAAAWQAIPAQGSAGGISERWFLFRTIHRALAKKSYALGFLYLFLILWGLLVSGLLEVVKERGEDVDVNYCTLTAYVLFSFFLVPIQQLHLLDPLPISRRFLFANIILPALLALLVGYGIGATGKHLFAQPYPAVVYQADSEKRLFPPYRAKNPWIRVPSEYCRIAWDGQPPEIRSPWGESHPAQVIPLSRWGRIGVYSPFNAPKEASPEFVAWQISRAVEAVDGRPVSADQIKERLLVEKQGKDASKGKGFNLYQEDSGRKPRAGVGTSPFLLMAAASIWLLAVGLFLRSLRAMVGATARKVFFFVCLMSILVVHLALLAAAITDYLEPTVAAAFLKIVVKQAGQALPGGYVSLLALWALLPAGAYWFAQSRFERSEIPPARSKD